MEEKIKIAVTDDETLFRAGILFILKRVPEFEVLFEAENGAELVKQLSGALVKPDIILMDIKMPEMNGVECTKVIQKKYPEINIIALSSYGGRAFITNMINVGASSYLLKNTSPKEVVSTIKKVYSTGFHYDQWVHDVLEEEKQNGKAVNIQVLLGNQLSKRELEILELICNQYTNHEIADKLFISPRTVEVHRKKLLLKTESKNTAGLVVYGIRNQLVQVSPDI
ncbi:DNA-binding response regulator [Neptunitalea chrysea]|uniref:DNA-binding response regulator n=1 Tax=Neptunitalea chrysea TaxID=1647581 RepID=A0A9W6EVY8_9FLAO|nr:response regulator transcription factor [Neptunitalea chrysea]GLB53122.1 DNA-binding response regulator [Neptunitalea chrysea]